MKRWTAYVQQEGNDLILPLPDDLLEELDWKEGDVLIWDTDKLTGQVTLRKKAAWYNILWSRVRKWKTK